MKYIKQDIKKLKKLNLTSTEIYKLGYIEQIINHIYQDKKLYEKTCNFIDFLNFKYTKVKWEVIK